MNSHDQLIALLEEGNPIPDPNALRRERVESAVYLATLKQRSSDVTQLHTRSKTEKTGKRNLWLGLAAAAAILLVIGVFAVLDQEDTTPPITEVPTTTIADVIETTIPSPDAAALDGYWQSSQFGLVLEDGSYSFTGPEQVLDTGTYEILADPDRIVLTTGPESQGCDPGSKADFAFVVDEAGVEFFNRFNDCPLFFSLVENGPYASVEPFELPEGSFSIVGLWGEPAGTFNLMFGDTDYQVIQDGEVVDSGTYALDTGPLRAEFTTTEGSMCTPGDVGVYLLFFEGDAIVLGSMADEACFGRTVIERFPYPPTGDE